MKSKHHEMRADLADACSYYFNMITAGTDVDQESRDAAARSVARLALKLHLYEQGMRAAKKGAQP